MVGILRRMQLLTEADGHALANLCIAYSTLVRAQVKLNESGLLVKSPSGYLQQNPLISIVNSAVGTINSLSREFGLTPASRSRIQMPEEPYDHDRIIAEMCG